MSVLEDSRDILSSLLTNKTLYNDELKSYLQLHVRSTDELKTINRIYNAFFSSYYLFEEVTKEYFSKCTKLLVATIGVTLVAGRVLKQNSEEVLTFLENTCDKNKEVVSDDFKIEFENYKKGLDIKLKNIEIGSKEHLSILFNLPLWFVSMVINQNGKEKAKEIFKTFINNKNPHYYLLNSLKNIDELDKDEFSKFKSDDKLIYKTSSKDSPLFKDSTFSRTNPNYEDIFKKLPKFNNKYVSLYEGETNSFYFRFLNEYLYKNNVINLAFKNINENKDVIKEVSLREMKDIFVFESTVGELIAHLAFKQDLIFYLPLSTNMTLFYNIPEYRVIFDVDRLDKIILEDENGIKEIAHYVENNGYLVYLVNTCDKKESSLVISSFIKENNEFKLIEEKEFLPSDSNKSFVYFAILKRSIHA